MDMNPKCPKCGEMTLWADDEGMTVTGSGIWCLNDACDFDAVPCKNDGKCVVVLTFGGVEAYFIGEPYCKCHQEYKEIENQSTGEVDALIEKTFPGCGWATWYHPTWWEEEGLTEDPFKEAP